MPARVANRPWWSSPAVTWPRSTPPVTDVMDRKRRAPRPSFRMGIFAVSVRFAATAVFLTMVCMSRAAHAQDTSPDSTQASPVQSSGERPALRNNRWQEDWSVLADPSLRTQWGDALKYLSLSTADPKTYLSFGMSLRERAEMSDAASFGIGGNPNNTY